MSSEIHVERISSGRLKTGLGVRHARCVDCAERQARLEEGGATSQQGNISDEQWEIFKLAFTTTGRVAILSDQGSEEWIYDYRILEAVR